MYQVKRLLVGLDLTEMDKTLLEYSSLLVKLFKVEVVYFLHVEKTLDLSKALINKYPDLLAPMDETLESDIRKNVEQYFTGECEYHIEVREGNATEEILRWGGHKEIDLIVMGRKLKLRGKGVLPGKLAKTVHCSIIFVPEAAAETISRILVPVDFSKASSMALEKALDIRRANGAEIILQNSYHVPSGYHMSGKSYEQFAEIMELNAYKDARNFIADCTEEDQIDIVLTLDADDDPAEKAKIVAQERKADLIIIGSEGRSGFASVLLGSVAERMTVYCSEIPLLVVKDKKENLSFLQALLKI